jgi:hypothetical protein
MTRSRSQTQFAYDGFGDPVSVVRDCCGAGHLNQTTTLACDALGDATSRQRLPAGVGSAVSAEQPR